MNKLEEQMQENIHVNEGLLSRIAKLFINLLLIINQLKLMARTQMLEEQQV